MLRIAVVKGGGRDAKMLVDRLGRYGEQNSLQLQIEHFPDAAPLLEQFNQTFDLIFLDPELPEKSGMEAARALRAADGSVTLVLVSKTDRYALEGYSVGAFDYILTPIREPALDQRLARALTHVLEKTGPRVTVRSGSELFGLEVRRIMYVEVKGHYLNWHVWPDRTCCAPGSLKGALSQLPDSFCPISRWYIVNLRYVRAVSGDGVLLGEERLQIGRSYKQAFIGRYSRYLAGGG